MIRTDPAQAVAEMRAFGLEPSVDFPGTNKPWPGIHLRCGRAVSPALANARRNGGVCRDCAAEDRGAARKRDHASRAVAVMVKNGWWPLHPYPGSDQPWLARHRRCGTARPTTLNQIRELGRGCILCYRADRGFRSWDTASAVTCFERAGLQPLEPYPGSSTRPWRALHLACGAEVRPRLGNVAAGQGPCNACALIATHRALKMPADKAAAIFRSAGLEPISDFPGVDNPWRAVHVPCGRETAPTISNIKRGQGGCSHCGVQKLSALFRMPEADARQAMLSHDLEPLEPYPGANKPWRSLHRPCGRDVRPTLGNVQQGRGICRYCNSSFPFDGPADVYLVADRGALKIGIAKVGSDRVPQHLRFGWELKWRLSGITGDEAYSIEQGVLAWWRDALDAKPVYGRAEMPQWGYTETASWEDASASATLSAALAFASELGVDAKPTEVAEPLDARPRAQARAVGHRKPRPRVGAGQEPLF